MQCFFILKIMQNLFFLVLSCRIDVLQSNLSKLHLAMDLEDHLLYPSGQALLLEQTQVAIIFSLSSVGVIFCHFLCQLIDNNFHSVGEFSAYGARRVEKEYVEPWVGFTFNCACNFFFHPVFQLVYAFL